LTSLQVLHALYVSYTGAVGLLRTDKAACQDRLLC
jgi:hypothetical protein